MGLGTNPHRSGKLFSGCRAILTKNPPADLSRADLLVMLLRAALMLRNVTQRLTRGSKSPCRAWRKKWGSGGRTIRTIVGDWLSLMRICRFRMHWTRTALWKETHDQRTMSASDPEIDCQEAMGRLSGHRGLNAGGPISRTSAARDIKRRLGEESDVEGIGMIMVLTFVATRHPPHIGRPPRLRLHKPLREFDLEASRDRVLKL